MWTISLCILLQALVIPSYAQTSGTAECNQPADLFFVIDGSESVRETDFQDSKNFVIDVLEGFDVRRDAVHIGSSTFGTRVYDGINLFGPRHRGLLEARLRTLTRSRLGTTLTNIAIEDMRDQFSKRGRTNVTWIGVVITDGKSVDIQATADQAEMARSEGINMIAVGVGEVFRDPAQAEVTVAELINIAGDPTSVRQTLNISAMVEEIQELLKEIICPAQNPATTVATTQAQTTPSSGGLDNGADCTDCMIGEHHGYWKHPLTCEKFFRIYSDADGKRVTTVQKCEPGLFWDQSVLTCTRPERVECENDPCKNRAVASYAVDGVCNAFIQCINGKSFRTCCPLSSRYVAGQGCVNDGNCPDNCSGEDDNSLLAPEECPSVRHPDNSQYYIENVPGHGNITRLCPERTIFDNALCVCTNDNSPWTGRLADCNPGASFPFASDFSDVSGNRLYAGTELVSVEGSAASFSGNGMVNIYRFSKDSFGEALVIRLRFKANTAEGATEALVTNCVYGSTQQASIAITVVRDNTGSHVVFRTDTDMDTQSFSVPFDPTSTNDLIYIYDGIHLTGIVNGVKEQRPLSGDILLSTSGIILGAGSKLNHFTGSVSQFELYKCLPAFAEGLRS